MNVLHTIGFYAILNYADKFLTFIIPLLVLRFHSDLYRDLEYLIAWSLLLAPWLDFGLRPYVFFAYCKTEDVADKKRILQTSKLILILFEVVYLLIGIAGALALQNVFIFLCGIRSIFLLYTQVQSYFCRLTDNPSNIILISITTNIAIVAVIFLYKFCNWQYGILEYSFAYMILLGIVLYSSILGFCGIVHFNFNLFSELWSFFKQIFVFAWPTFVILFVTAIENNFIKIWGYSQLNKEAYTEFLLLIRCFIIVLLAHSAALTFYQKQIFNKKSNQIKIYLKYLLVVCVGFAGMVCFIAFSWYTAFIPNIPLNGNFVIVAGIYLFMFSRAYLESFFLRDNKLLFSMVGSVCGFSVLFLLFLICRILYPGTINLRKLLLFQLAAEGINFVFNSFYLIINAKIIRRKKCPVVN